MGQRLGDGEEFGASRIGWSRECAVEAVSEMETMNRGQIPGSIECWQWRIMQRVDLVPSGYRGESRNTEQKQGDPFKSYYTPFYTRW